MTANADSPALPPRLDEKTEVDVLFVELVEVHRPLVQRLCQKLLSDDEDAEDAAQQTFLLAYQSLLSGTRPRQPQAWLSAIAQRECWARHHRSRRQRAAPQVAPRAELDPSDRAVLHAELAAVMEGLSLLPPQQKQALLLYELGGLSYRQLAAELEITESAADALLTRARRALRRGRFVLFPLPFSLPRPRSLERLFRLVERAAHAGASVGAQATAAGATTMILVTATAALGNTATPVASPARAVAAAPAPATSARAKSPDPIAERAARLTAHPDTARPAVAIPDGLASDSSNRSQPAGVVSTPAVSSPARALAPQDQHLAEAHPSHRAVAETPEPPGATTTASQTNAPTPPASSPDQSEPATSPPPATDQTTDAADPATDPALPPAPAVAETPSPPTNPGTAGVADNPPGSPPADVQQDGAPGEGGTIDGATPGADPAPPVSNPSPQPPIVADPSTPGAQEPKQPDGEPANRCSRRILWLLCRVFS